MSLANFGIPTMYRGIQFRSRLEARWAAFFDLVGWAYEYEPLDLRGWIPDFLLTQAKVLVEVKPVDEFPQDIADEIARSGMPDTYEPMIVGRSVSVVSPHGIDACDGRPIGWLRANPPSWRPELAPTWGRAIVQVFSDSQADLLAEYGFQSEPDVFGLYHEFDPFMLADPGFFPPPWPSPHEDYGDGMTHNRIDPRCSILKYWEVYTPGDPDVSLREDDKLADLWKQAGNEVQWRKRRSTP